jgi:hypothetical protein
MERTAIPPRVNINHLRTLVRQKREEGLAAITLMLDDVDSMIIECEFIEQEHDAVARDSAAAAAARKQLPPKTTPRMLIGTTTT